MMVLAVITLAATSRIMIVANALISGVTPSLTFENTTIGKVELPGPLTKLAITRSSKLSVKASSQAATTAGAITGLTEGPTG